MDFMDFRFMATDALDSRVDLPTGELPLRTEGALAARRKRGQAQKACLLLSQVSGSNAAGPQRISDALRNCAARRCVLDSVSHLTEIP